MICRLSLFSVTLIVFCVIDFAKECLYSDV